MGKCWGSRSCTPATAPGRRAPSSATRPPRLQRRRSKSSMGSVSFGQASACLPQSAPGRTPAGTSCAARGRSRFAGVPSLKLPSAAFLRAGPARRAPPGCAAAGAPCGQWPGEARRQGPLRLPQHAWRRPRLAALPWPRLGVRLLLPWPATGPLDATAMDSLAAATGDASCTGMLRSHRGPADHGGPEMPADPAAVRVRSTTPSTCAALWVRGGRSEWTSARWGHAAPQLEASGTGP
mmetsp:Transcript_1751/g.5246  ORF Transcript_1751/g.5246 Transcript_1751/m.5246 type:complete len:237 (+) Transcript_1751:930-1640(+)